MRACRGHPPAERLSRRERRTFGAPRRLPLRWIASRRRRPTRACAASSPPRAARLARRSAHFATRRDRARARRVCRRSVYAPSTPRPVAPGAFVTRVWTLPEAYGSLETRVRSRRAPSPRFPGSRSRDWRAAT